MQRLLERAEAVGGPAIVFTFDPHPVRLLRPDQCPPPLTWTERKAELLAAWASIGLSRIRPMKRCCSLVGRRVLPADCSRLHWPPGRWSKDRTFISATIAKAPSSGSPSLTAAADITLDVVPPVEIDGEIVSSSRVRELIRAGQVEEAADAASAPYRIRGMVTHGAGRGAKIGFPTANLGAIDTLLPAQGVYAGRAMRPKVQSWPAAINLGPSPTFGDAMVRVEVHLIGYARTALRPTAGG